MAEEDSGEDTGFSQPCTFTQVASWSLAPWLEMETGGTVKEAGMQRAGGLGFGAPAVTSRSSGQMSPHGVPSARPLQGQEAEAGLRALPWGQCRGGVTADPEGPPE